MGDLRQSTAQVINFGPFYDSTDGDTEETALTIAQSDMLLSKDGGALTQKSAAGNATHDTQGNYTTTLSTTDTATVGILKLYVHVAGALGVWETFNVIPAATYDAKYTDGLNNFDPVSDAVANVTLVDTTTTNTDMVGTDNALLAASYTAPDNAGIAANGVAINNLNDISAAQVNAEMLDVLTVDTFAELGGVPSATSSILDKISWSFSLSRNKLMQTSTTTTLRNDADIGDIATATVSDDTVTFIRNEYT